MSFTVARAPKWLGSSVLVGSVLALLLSSTALSRAAEPAGCRQTYAAPPLTQSQDWLAKADPREMAAYPPNGTVIGQNPPVFRWPRLSQRNGYEVRVAGPGVAVAEKTRENWMFLPRPLPSGSYTWQVRPVGGQWSDARTFAVAEGTPQFVVPDAQAILAAVTKVGRPRGMPHGEALSSLLDSLRAGSRQALFAALAQAAARPGKAGAADADSIVASSDDADDETDAGDGTGGRKGEDRTLKRKVYAEAGRAVVDAHVWFVTRDEALLSRIKERALNLAAVSLSDQSVKVNDLAVQRLTYSLAVIYDLLHDVLSAAERTAIAEAVDRYTRPLFERYVLDPERSLAHRPMNAHGFRILGSIAATGLLMAGDLEQADEWVRQALPLYIAIFNPWGGDDGGFANGTNYAVTEAMNHAGFWDTIRNAAGIDLGRTAWARGFASYLYEFLPPRSPVGTFGNGADQHLPERWMLAAAVLGPRLASPLAADYARAWGGAPPHYLTAFAPEPAAGTQGRASQPCNAAFFPSIGWTAMHSDIADPRRVSVYFKSSPYGSHNHSHADQNAFVINAGGEPLAIDSGYYDAYRSPHEMEWTIQTKAHNAVTFDGGEGQKPRSKAASGRILAFAHDPAVDYVVGDASRAYGKEVSKAIRSLVYLRPDTVLVYDLLESGKPRRWEWNIHAASDILEAADGSLRIERGPTSLCVRRLAGPETTFSKTNRFPAPPKGRRAGEPDQWHGRFSTVQPSRSAEFLYLLSIGCGAGASSRAEATAGGGLTARVGGHSIRFAGAEVFVQ